MSSVELEPGHGNGICHQVGRIASLDVRVGHLEKKPEHVEKTVEQIISHNFEHDQQHARLEAKIEEIATDSKHAMAVMERIRDGQQREAALREDDSILRKAESRKRQEQDELLLRFLNEVQKLREVVAKLLPGTVLLVLLFFAGCGTSQACKNYQAQIAALEAYKASVRQAHANGQYDDVMMNWILGGLADAEKDKPVPTECSSFPPDASNTLQW